MEGGFAIPDDAGTLHIICRASAEFPRRRRGIARKTVIRLKKRPGSPERPCEYSCPLNGPAQARRFHGRLLGGKIGQFSMNMTAATFEMAIQREGCRRLDALHGETRRNILESRDFQQFFIEFIELRDIGGDHFQHVIDVARHSVEFDNFRYFIDLLREILQPRFRMLADDNGDIDRQAQANRLRRQNRDAAGDDARGFQFLNAFPAGGLRQANPRGDVGDRGRDILLENGENFIIDRVHDMPPPGKSEARVFLYSLQI